MPAQPGILLLGLAIACPLSAAGLHVSPGGDDAGPGTAQAPWRTLQHAADLARAGDTVFVHAGTYRESVLITRGGTAEARIGFTAVADGKVVLDGTDPVRGQWRKYRGDIYSVETDGPVLQVFVGEQQQTWARWPNRNPADPWDRATWASAGIGSRYGRLVDPQLAATGVDWTGATAVLNVAHQFRTWTRPVATFAAAASTLTYARDLQPITNYADKEAEWEDDRYYLAGKLEVLDAPGEWFFDAAASRLYFWAPGGDDPGRLPVAVKRRALGIELRDVAGVTIRGFRFVGCTFLVRGNDNVIADCELISPVHAFHMSEPGTEQPGDVTEVTGDGNAVLRCAITGANTTGLAVHGRRNLVEDCLVVDSCWDGSLAFPSVAIEHPGDNPREGNTLRHCTVSRSGNTLVRHSGPGTVIEYCHIHDGGLVAKDVALVQTGSPRTAGSIVRYNWVHGCRPYIFAGGLTGGLGIRGDDQTRRLTVHHNVVWDCDRDGIIVKGDFNEVHHNTVFAIGAAGFSGNALSLHTETEPTKPWQNSKTPLLAVQNEHTRACNNVLTSLTGDRVGTPYPARPGVEHNLLSPPPGDELVRWLEDAVRFDFRPRAGSPLIDAGMVLPGFNDSFAGAAPDLGAYENGIAPWRAGRRAGPGMIP